MVMPMVAVYRGPSGAAVEQMIPSATPAGTPSGAPAAAGEPGQYGHVAKAGKA